MANLNRIILVGRLTADPEARTTTDGLPMTKFRLAVNRPMATGAENVDFVDIVTWKKVAEVSGQYLKKGQLVLVDGRIQNRTFEDQTGQKRWVTEVIAQNMTMLEKSQSTAGGPNPKSQTETINEEAVADADLASDLPF